MRQNQARTIEDHFVKVTFTSIIENKPTEDEPQKNGNVSTTSLKSTKRPRIDKDFEISA